MFSCSELRREARRVLGGAQPSCLTFVGFSLLVSAVLNVLDVICSGITYDDLASSGIAGLFVYILTLLISLLLEAGRVEYCGAALRGEGASYGDLFCGFSYVFRFLSVMLAQAFLVAAGFCCFFVPGLLLLYRYRFALYILCEDPTQGVAAILRRSAAELQGYKWQLLRLDLSFLPHALLCLIPATLWQLAPEAVYAALPLPLLSLIGTATTFPYLLLTFWRTEAELLMRDRILAAREPKSPPVLP